MINERRCHNMLHGTFIVPRVTEESVCRVSEDCIFTEMKAYKIHATALMPNIPFAAATIQPYDIDSSIFVNDEETKLDFESTIKCQNYLTTRYIGRSPLEWYDKDSKTAIGRQFVLICRNGNPSESFRVFGTENAVRGYNPSANENVQLPGGA